MAKLATLFVLMLFTGVAILYLNRDVLFDEDRIDMPFSLAKVVTLSVLVIITGIAILYLNKDVPFDEIGIFGLRVLVTGSSQGIGEQIAYQYARLGASVVLSGRSVEKLKQVLAKCKDISTNKDAAFSYVVTDLGEREAPGRLVQDAVSILGGLDHVIINHALIPAPHPWDTSEEMYNLLSQTLQVNTVAPALIAAHAYHHLKKSNGSLSFINSVLGKYPFPYSIPYSSSKHALDAVAYSLRREWQDSSVSVTNCVLGRHNTPGMNRYIEGIDKMFSRNLRSEVPFENVTDTAYGIMKSTHTRQREVFFPNNGKYLVWFREILLRFDIFPPSFKKNRNK